MIRMAICDDHPVFRAGILGLLRDEPDLQIVVEAGTAAELERGLDANEVDLVLLDLDLPDRHGLEIVASVADRARVLVLSAFDDARSVRTALERGATGFVRKDAPPASLLEAIRSAAGGTAVLAPDLAVRVAGAMRTESAERELARKLDLLTDRQREVLALLADGRSNREIARSLFVSEGTVKNHVTQILQTLDVTDRTRLAVLLARRGGAR
jgi:DNA-binding NarL/FixJ family response regulator